MKVTRILIYQTETAIEMEKWLGQSKPDGTVSYNNHSLTITTLPSSWKCFRLFKALFAP